jgi:hypothetical protein
LGRRSNWTVENEAVRKRNWGVYAVGWVWETGYGEWSFAVDGYEDEEIIRCERGGGVGVCFMIGHHKKWKQGISMSFRLSSQRGEVSCVRERVGPPATSSTSPSEGK